MTGTDKKSILIAGYYGFGNTGDEAILSAILAQLCQQRKDLEFTVVSANPAETTSTFNVNSVHWKDVEALHRAAEESDLMILGGGGLFQDYWGVPKDIALTASHWGISFNSAIAMLAVFYQKPFMIYSVGVGPLETQEGRELTRWTFDLAQVATVRDAESRDLLLSLGVAEEKISIAPDPALTLPLDSPSAENILRAQDVRIGEHPIVGVCIRNWSEQEGGWKKELAGALDEFLAAYDCRLLFIPFQVQEHALENDRSVALEIISMMQNQDRAVVLEQAYSPAVAAGLISHCQFLIGMRLHSLIFAANAGIPSMALVYDPKVYNFMKSLDLSEYALPLRTLTVEEGRKLLSRAWEQRAEIQKTMQGQAEVLKEFSRKLPEMALHLLEETSERPFPTETVQSLAVQQTRSLARKEAEVQALSSRLDAKIQQAHLLQIQVGEQQREMELRQAQFEQHAQALQSDLDARRHELNEILSSKTWRLAEAFRHARLWMVPVGSLREKILYRLSKAVALVRYSIQRHGLLKAVWSGFRILGIRVYHWSKRVFERNKYERELKQLDAIISQHSGFFDLFHVPMGWKTILFQRFQHVSLQTAKLGGLALYGGHPIVDRGITVYQKAADNLYVFDATNRQVVERIFQALDMKRGQPRILRIQSIDLVTTAEDVIRFIENGFAVVYEYIDEINPAITGAVPDSVYRRHLAILKDERVIVVATSDQLAEEVQQFRSKNFILSTNGVDLDHWRIPRGKPPSDLSPALNGNLIVGYHGALAKWMDYDLLRSIADAGPYEVVLIGHEHDGAFAESGLKDHPRVHFLGSKTYFELNAYAVYYDIAILPFKKTNLTQAVSPVKIFEYMAARKPIVTTDLRECQKYRSCLIASTQIEFLEQLKHAAELRNDLDYLRLLDQEAAENSWERKTIEILKLAGVKI